MARRAFGSSWAKKRALATSTCSPGGTDTRPRAVASSFRGSFCVCLLRHILTKIPKSGLPLFTNCREEAFSETEFPLVPILDSWASGITCSQKPIYSRTHPSYALGPGRWERAAILRGLGPSIEDVCVLSSWYKVI